MIVSSFNFLIKTYRNYLFRNNFKRYIVSYQKKQTNYYQTNQLASIRKVQKTAKETIYSLVLIAGVVTVSGICYLILHEIYSRETPNGIYKEAAKICLNNVEVQQALGTPITVHRSPEIDSISMNLVRAKTFNEKGHESMTVSFYLTGQQRSGVVAIKVQKNISNKFIYDYILVQLDHPWKNQNILRLKP